MFSFGIQAFPRSLGRIGNLFIRYGCSSSGVNHDVFYSQFHVHGVRHFQKPRLPNRQSTTVIFQIEKLITELEKQRIRLKQFKETQHIKDDVELIPHGHCSKYFEIYSKLQQKMGELKVLDEWGFRMVAWFNVQPLLPTLIDELLARGNKPDHKMLIESIGWMKPRQMRVDPESSAQELIKQKGKIDNFYRQLPVRQSIGVLKEIESIFEVAVTQHKGKYYHTYLMTNIDELLATTPRTDQEIEDLLWLFEMYVITFNDDRQIIQKFESFFLETKLLQDRRVLTAFIRIYNQTGRANLEIYNQYIKQHIKNSPQNIIEVQMLNLEFLIHSEVSDEQTLNEILKNIAKIAKHHQIVAGIKLHVHYLLHYLKIRDIKFSFPFQLFREFSEICRTFEEDGSFAKAIAIELDQKSRREGAEYYNSSCVLKKKDSEGKKNKGERIEKAEGFKKFKDVKFCCLNIDYCVMDENNKKGVVLEKNYHRFVQSGRLIRMEEVKAQILRHYGLEINYMYSQGKGSEKNWE